MASLRRAIPTFLSPFTPNLRTTSRIPNVEPVRKQTTASASKSKRRRAEKSGKGELSSVGTLRPLINWYPGHIAKAERSLLDSLRSVDVVIEVRDSRAPSSTSHPKIPKWIGERRTHIIAMGKADLASESVRKVWKNYLGATHNVRFVDGKRGKGISELKKLAVRAGEEINSKRKAKGMLNRPVRALVVGYPNVGKSAVINRLVGKKAAKSANTPGVTKNFQWIRIDNELELLDMPGIIPMRLDNQDVALRLAMCDDIGHASYDRQIIAAKMVDELKRVHNVLGVNYFDIEVLNNRYKVDATHLCGEEWLFEAAQKCHCGDVERMANRLFVEFRSGVLGPVGLEAPPTDESRDGPN